MRGGYCHFWMVAAAFCAAVISGCGSESIKPGKAPVGQHAPIAERRAGVPPAVSDELESLVPPVPETADEAPEPGEETWSRVQSRLQFDLADNAEVRRELAWYRAHPRYLNGVARRARPFLYHIVSELEARDLPGELALLPILESGFRANATSPYGAAGLWQFMGGTGNKFGLEVNRWYDGRMDVTRSTTAALSYLEALHDRFGEDWLLAIAAYNAGWGNLEKVLGRQRRLGRPTDFWSLPLGRETRALVGRMIALSTIFRAPEDHGLELEPLPGTPWFAEVELDRPTDLRRYGAALGMPREEFDALNAAFRRGHTGPGGGTVLVPLHRVEQARALAEAGVGHSAPPAIAAAEPRRTAGGRTTATHRVKSGESLWTIARQHGVTTAQLAAANGLSSRATLRVGQQLRVPGKEARRPAQAADARPVRYRVRQGDSLWTISRQFKVSVKELLAWNGLRRERPLQPGQELLVSRPG